MELTDQSVMSSCYTICFYQFIDHNIKRRIKPYIFNKSTHPPLKELINAARTTWSVRFFQAPLTWNKKVSIPHSSFGVGSVPENKGNEGNLSIYKARHAHKCLYTVLPKYSKIQVLSGITSCRLMRDNKQAIELNDLLMK